MTLDAMHWQERLTSLAAELGVVGASLAVRHHDEVATAAAGVLNLSTGQPVTTDSVFSIGSITKVWTATLVMQLVDDDLLDLDAPLVRYLPEFRVGDPVVSATVTARQLLCHSSGIDGDFFLDTGRGDDALGRFVGAMGGLAQNHPQGAIMSYTNCGYAVLGHLVASRRGTTWESALRERVLAPLRLRRAGTFPEEAILGSVAVGHVGDSVSETWSGFRSMGPTGLIHATARELVDFARVHMRGGVAADGTQVLSQASCDAMTAPQIESRDIGEATHWGLGWALDRWDGQLVYGHSGSLTGQLAFLKVLPEAGLAIALTTNGGRDQGPEQLYAGLLAEIAYETAGVTAPAPLRPPSPPLPVDAAQIVGTYTRAGFEATVEEALDGGARVRVGVTGGLVGLVPDMVMELIGYDGDGRYLGRFEGADSWISVVFFEMDGERYLHASGRAFRRR